VTVPHTWQTIADSPDYVGVAWYKLDFPCPAEWKQHFVRIEFEAVFHTAHIYLNGSSVGEHIGKGYTAFTCDLSAAMKSGQTNTLLVRVDNTPSEAMLPRMKSFDWANDGGLVRPVTLLVTPRVFIERIEVDATPDLERSAEVKIRVVVRNTLNSPHSLRLNASIRREGAASEKLKATSSDATVAANSSVVVALPAIPIESPALWHFDAPHLYVATVDLHTDAGSHRFVDTFGIRKFEARGTEFYLNGEPVRLMGVERMAGSHPEFGMAEPTAWIEANHRDMKELNCVFTRVHWAQDKRVLDFCDRNGILMQEEVPAWGYETFQSTTDELQHSLEQNGLEQLREMVARDRNHPCIVSWGLCNEVDGKNPRSREFARALSVEARRLDPSRLLTYASNSLGENPQADMAGEFDFISTNEYYGSWARGGPKEVREHMDRICKAFPNKPIVVSEYGWCECQPSIPPGDPLRIEIVDGHTEVFRQFPQVAGATYFDYNDYRTLVGDKGVGSFRQRVHGVVDLYANRKPSFQALRLQCSPIESLGLKRTAPAHFLLKITSRHTLPSYTLRGYRVRWVVYGYDDLPMEGRIDDLAAIEPGGHVELSASFVESDVKRIVVDFLRPTGYSVATSEWHAS
jgi:beta-glucuronidase